MEGCYSSCKAGLAVGAAYWRERQVFTCLSAHSIRLFLPQGKLKPWTYPIRWWLSSSLQTGTLSGSLCRLYLGSINGLGIPSMPCYALRSEDCVVLYRRVPSGKFFVPKDIHVLKSVLQNRRVCEFKRCHHDRRAHRSSMQEPHLVPLPNLID